MSEGNPWRDLPESIKIWIRDGSIKGVSIQSILYWILVASFLVFAAVLTLLVEISH